MNDIWDLQLRERLTGITSGSSGEQDVERRIQVDEIGLSQRDRASERTSQLTVIQANRCIGNSVVIALLHWWHMAGWIVKAGDLFKISRIYASIDIVISLRIS